MRPKPVLDIEERTENQYEKWKPDKGEEKELPGPVLLVSDGVWQRHARCEVKVRVRCSRKRPKDDRPNHDPSFGGSASRMIHPGRLTARR